MRTKNLFASLLLLLFALALAACAQPTPPPPTEPAETEVPPTAVSPTVTVMVSPSSMPPPVASPDAPAEGQITWSPQLVAYSPATNEETQLDGAITLRFDQPMAQESVERAFQISLADGDTAEIEGRFEWPRPDTVVFTPASSFQRDQTYRVKVSTEAQGTNAQNLREEVDLTVQTVGFLEVSELIPADGTQEIAVDSAVTVAFNRPVVPLVATSNQADLPQPLTIVPDIDGRGEWVSTSIYRFTPENGFAGGSSYDVTVNAGLTDITGGVLDTAVTTRFTTEPPQILQTIPYPDQTSFDPTAPFTVTFNMPMDTASTEAAVSLNPAVPVEFRWRENNTVLGIVPQTRLDLATRYELSLSQAAQSASGQATLDDTYAIPFETVPFPGITYTDPSNGQSDHPPESGGVYFEFASPMAWDTFVDDIVIEPAPDVDELRLDYFEGGTWLGLNFPLLPQTAYTVTIPATAADPYGNTLGEAYVLRFTTGDYAPYYTPSLMHYVNHFSTSFPTNISILQRNNSRIDLALYDAGLPLDALDYYRVSDLPGPDQALATWSLRPQTEANRDSTLTVQLNDGQALPTGLYYLTTIGDQERERGFDPRLYLLVVAETNLVVKEMVDGVYVWATNLETGQPASNMSLTLFDYEGNSVADPITTDANGLARFDYVPPEGYFDSVTVMANQPGEAGFGLSSSRWSQGADPWQMNLPHDPSREVAQTVYLFTDRPLYRPGDTVYFRGYLRDNNYGRYRLPTNSSVTVVAEQRGFSGEEEPFQLELTLDVDSNGGFSGEFDLPDEARLGSYGLTVLDATSSYVGGGQIQVAEFRKPEFEVSVTTAVDEVLRGQATQATVQATYFFGGPAANLNVQYTVSDSAFTPSFPLPYSFSDDVYSPWYYDPRVEDGYFGGQILTGEGTTDGNGQFVIDIPADLLADAPAGSRQLTIEATVRDVSNQIVANRTSQIHHAAEGYVGIQADGNSIFRANEDTAVNVISVDWAGEAVSGQPVEINFFQRDWVRNDETGYYEPNDVLVADELVTTDNDGQASASFVPEQAGQYRAQAVFRDAGGRTHSSSVFFWVSGGDPAQWRPDPANRIMTLVPNQDEYTVGETAQILVQSPFEGPVQAWLTIERGRLLTQELITLQSNSDVVNVPIGLDHAPNVFVSITAVKGVTAESDSPYADLRLGVVELPVSPDPFALQLNIVPQEEQVEPGDTAVFDITLTNNNGQPISADLTLALVDKALLSLASDNAAHILDAFYGRQPYRSMVGASLLMSAEGLDLDLLEEFGGQGGGAGGGVEVAEEAMAVEGEVMDDAALAQEAPAPTSTAARAANDEAGGLDVRTEFEDTAYWQARLTTDENGQATVEIPLPDNLTTWQLNVKAMSEITLVGQGQSEITVQKPLLLRPITPRFFTLGDVVELGTVVNNNSPADQTVDVSLAAEGLTIGSPISQTVSVPAGDSAVVRWTVTADQLEAQDVNLTFTAVSEEYSDATKPTFGFGDEQLIPIYRYNAEDIVGTSGVLTPEDARRVEAVLLPEGLDPELGDFTVYLNGSLAAVVLDSVEAINRNREYEPDRLCAHGIAYQLLPNAVTARALSLLNETNTAVQSDLDEIIPRDIDDIVSLQKEDGGWGWCTTVESEPSLTAYILLALDKAQEAGYDVPSDVVNRAADYLRGEIENLARLENSGYQANREAYYLYVLAEVGQNITAEADALFDENVGLLDAAGLAYLLHAYELNGGSPNQERLLADLNGLAVVSATGAHWESAGYQSLWSDIQTTAVVLHALVAADPDNAFGPQAVRWLIKVRAGDIWGTLYDSSWVLLALTDWMVSTGELQADFAYEVYLNETAPAVQTGAFTRENITQTDRLVLPLSELNQSGINYFDFQRDGTTGNLYYNAYLDSFIDANLVSAINRGLTVQRAYFDADCTPTPDVPCEPLENMPVGEQVRVELTVIAQNNLNYVVIEDFFPAGAEAIDPGLLTSPSTEPGFPGNPSPYPVYGYDQPYRYWGWWYFNEAQYRDDRVVFTSQYLPAGTYSYSYTLQAVIPGTYQVRPTFARQEFFPEVNGRADGLVLTIE